MAGSRKRPGKFPDWLFETARLFETPTCQWTCSGCGAPFYFPQQGTKHGGPPDRSIGDPRYSAPRVGPCYRSHQYGVKCVTPKGTRVLMHEGAPNPMQPEQPDAENIETIIATRGGRRMDNRVQKEGE